MERNREGRRVAAAANGLSRRRYRSSSLRDSPEEDGAMELQDTVRLRDRGNGKKDRDRDNRDRERERDRISRSKRRRGDRLIHREDGVEDSSEESVNDEEDDDDDDGGGGASVRMLPPNPGSILNHRKSFPPAKSFRAAAAAAAPSWKAADEMIGVSVPRKARSASTKRTHECWPAGGGGVVTESIHRQASTSPVRSNLTPMVTLQPPVSPPSSSNASVRKKLKPNGPKLRPPKSTSKRTSMAQDEIEIEIAEVLYGMMRQPQGPPKQEIGTSDSMKFDPKSTTDSKSRVSSPISNSSSAFPTPSSILPQNSSSSATPISVTAPKRKKPRPVDENTATFNLRNSPISSAAKAETDQPANNEIPSLNVEKVSGSAAENGGVSNESRNSQALPATSESNPESVKQQETTGVLLSNSKPLTEESECKDLSVRKEEPPSPMKESNGLRLEDKRDDMTVTKANSSTMDVDSQRDDKYKIDLMAPPPLRASPERDGEIDFVTVDSKPMVIDADTEMKPVIKEEEKGTTRLGKELMNLDSKGIAEEAAADSKKSTVYKDRKIDLQFDLEKTDRDGGNTVISSNKLNHHVQKQQQQPGLEKAGPAQASSLPLPMSLPGWPSGLPPMGYVAPLPGVVSMDGSALSTAAAMQPPSLLFPQPRPKRCATHFYIARNILYHQQISRMNPFWPAAAGSASLFGPKHGNLSIVPSSDLQGNLQKGATNSMQDKGQSLGIFSGHAVKDKGSQPVNVVDTAQRKQILLQQSLPPGAPSNILHGPAFILPLSQQQAAVASSVRPISVKSPPTSGNTNGSVASNSSNPASVSASTAAAAIAAPAMSFNYPSMPGNEPQYLAILQNNGFTYPIPAHVGAPPAYRGTHAHSMPFFNGSFYSSQMLHPSQLQQQQPLPQSHSNHQGLQNASTTNGPSSSQKNQSNQQQRPHASSVSGSFQGFPATRNQPSQQPQQQQNHASHQTRQLESEIGGEDSPSTADSRVTLSNLGVYGPNFPMPMHAPPSFALMTSASMAAVSGAPNDKKQQPHPHLQGSKGLEPSQTIALSFAPANGAPSAPGFDLSSIAPNHPLFQSLPEITRQQGYHQIMAAAAQVAQQKKNYRVSEEGKPTVTHSSVLEDDRKTVSGKTPPTVGQSIAFSRADLADASLSTMPAGATVIDSSARNINLGSAARTSGSVIPSAMNSINVCSSQHQQQRNHQQHQQHQQQMIQLQKQQQFAVAAAAAAARTKTSASSNGNVYAEHPSSASMAAKFPNALSSFSQNLGQSNNSSPAQSPQWKNSVRTTTSQVPTASLSSSNTSSIKNLPQQQQSRPQQNHSQISFAANSKSTTQSQGPQPATSNQSPSPGMIGSPTTSSMSKGAGGSPRTATSSSMGHKVGQSSSLSSQQTKNAPSMPNQKSSPVGGRNVTSILGNNQMASSSNSGNKLSQQPQQQQQQHLPKQTLQQAQLLFPYMQARVSHSNNSTNPSASSGYYLQRRRPEQQSQGSGGTSNGMLSLCHPVTLGGNSTTDPAKAVAAAAAAAAANNMKGGGLPSQAILHPTQFTAAQSSGNPHQLVPAGFPYVHTAAVQVKPTEQKQPAGG